MNNYAYRTTGLAIKTIYNLSKARVNLHGTENIPTGALIFVINHFTRIETLLLPYYIFHQIRIPVWSLAHAGFFKGAVANLLEMVGAVSTRDPDRDRLIVKTLLTAEAAWIIFPEGRMVKDKQIVNKGKFMVSAPGGQKRKPHTGAAALALRTEFYRQRLTTLLKKDFREAARLMKLFGVSDIEAILENHTRIVPVNVAYYPMRARENALSNLAEKLVNGIDDAAMDELMTEGSMLLSGVDVDIRFGKPIKLEEYLCEDCVRQDIESDREINFDDLLPSRRTMGKKCDEIMNRYMSEIYNLTTVNHDHLFASMLKHCPFRKIEESDLRRRVYCVIESGMNRKGVYFHDSLKSDQISLLTDDRYRKWEDFISLAIDKKTVFRRGDFLVKNPKVFSTPFDFHRSRIENPVGVIANEAQTLKRLQRSIRLHAWMPGFFLRRRLSKRLRKEALEEFERDYRKFFTEESKDRRIGRPFLTRGSRRKPGVLLIHGYLASPAEVEPLARFLADRGFRVYAPRLKGHGTTPEDLAGRSHKDWRASVDKGYAVIKSLCDRVVVGGFSTGGGLALDLATRIDNVAGVFTVCSPLRIKFLSSRFSPAVEAWSRLLKKMKLDDNHVDFVESEPENPEIKYARNPVAGIREVERLMSSLEPRLRDLKMPALVIQSLNDPVVDREGSMELFKLLGSEEKSYLVFDMDRHVIIGGKGAHRVHKAVAGFIENSLDR